MSTPAPGQPRRVSPAVYRRRRLVALLALIAVVTAVVLIIVRPGQATPTPTETAVAKPTVAPVATESATPTPTPTVDVSDYKECSTKNLEVLPVLDSVDYQAGVLPNLSLTIQNTGKTACFYNVGTSAQELTITSGAETYWVSTDCQSEKSDTVAILEPGVVYPSAPIVWERQRSSPDTCGGEREVVPAGGASYYLTTKVGGVSSKSSAQFLLY
ncbi:MAG: hypothetical protein RR853_01550 [Aurantimicrobium sp.]|uniref:hypothetical protein n=1 Tax=Aurantimicrobium TaxID=1705353 RepID=UPI002475F722|nr:hypothetical protein [Aurantimicrobium minutum]MDH6207630.1 hypothetical protein [Aurantimicrobium minutum]MDH6410512.1 hypothetical protein [Aurantimicrobium minutum]MDH6425325.1 hypothetical protein [Aurantimicrobium minutum]